MNKKALYESIMKNVAKEVKKTLNEQRYSGEFSDPQLQKAFYNLAGNILLMKSLPADINNMYMCGRYASKVIEHCMGYILEGYVLNRLNYDPRGDERIKFKVSTKPTRNDVYDADMTLRWLDEDTNSWEEKTIKLEIKAFKDGKKSNITFTANQLADGAMDDVCLIYIDYSIVNDDHFVINDILVAEPGTIKVTRHGGETLKMTSIAQDLEDGKYTNMLGEPFKYSRKDLADWQRK